MLQEIGAATLGPTVVDCEAGLEHLSRATPRHADRVVVVLEPYYRALEVGARAAELATELGVPEVVAVANKIRTSADEGVVQEFCQRKRMRLAGVLPYDDSVLDAERAGRALADYSPQSAFLREVDTLAGVLV